MCTLLFHYCHPSDSFKLSVEKYTNSCVNPLPLTIIKHLSLYIYTPSLNIIHVNTIGNKIKTTFYRIRLYLYGEISYNKNVANKTS